MLKGLLGTVGLECCSAAAGRCCALCQSTTQSKQKGSFDLCWGQLMGLRAKQTTDGCMGPICCICNPRHGLRGTQKQSTHFLHCHPSSLAALCLPGFATCMPRATQLRSRPGQYVKALLGAQTDTALSCVDPSKHGQLAHKAWQKSFPTCYYISSKHLTRRLQLHEQAVGAAGI